LRDTQKLRILFVIQDYPPDKVGGHQIRCQRTADSLRERGHEVFVLTGRPHNGVLEISDDIWRVLYSRWSYPKAPFYRQIKAIDFNTKCFSQALETFQPNIVGLWAIIGASLPFMLNIIQRSHVPIVHFVGGHTQLDFRRCYWFKYWSSPSKRGALLSALKDIIAAIVSRYIPTYPPNPLRLGTVCFNSKFIRDWHIASGYWIQNPIVIESGVDTTKFQAPVPRNYAVSPRLLVSSRFALSKGIKFILESFAKIRECNSGLRLSIIGPETSEGIELIKKDISRLMLSDCVRILKPVPNEQMPGIYLAHDILIQASKIESWSNSVLEAMACGMVPITSDRGGLRELINPGINGLLFSYGNSHELCQKMESLINNPLLLQKIGLEAQRHVSRNYSLEKYISKIEKLLVNTYYR
jgi:glycosyltransferase involved in cell wall biosynthesis